MKAAEMLADEHRLIGRVMSAFAHYVDQLEKGVDFDPTDLGEFVVFFQEFVEFRHQDKEETILIPELVRAGFSWDERPISEIRRDHEHERYLVRELRYAAASGTTWSKEQRRHVVAIARELVAFLRAHIDKEELLLLPAMDRLSSAVSERIRSDFERFDRIHPAVDGIVDLQTLGNRLAERYAA